MMNYTKIFHTIPFPHIKEMHRNANHKKVDEKGILVTPKGSWIPHTETKQTNNTPVMAAIAVNDFIGIDLDNNDLYNQALIHAPQTAFVSKSVPEEDNRGGHLVFKYTLEDYQTLKLITKVLKDMKIDVQMDHAYLFLPTKQNKTKELITKPLTSLKDLTPITPKLMNWLLLLALPAIQAQNSPQTSLYFDPKTMYGYLFKDLTSITEDIVTILTPKKTHPNITRMDDIPKGQATSWFLAVRKKLMSDSSVSKEVFSAVCMKLASFWTVDRGPKAQLHYYIDRETKSPDFIYDEDWETTGMTYINGLRQTVNVYFASKQGLYITYNMDTDEIITFDTFTKAADCIRSDSAKKESYTKPEIINKALSIQIEDTPLSPPRLTKLQGKKPMFNYFTPSEAVQIMQSGKPPIDYREPTYVLEFLEHLIPHEPTRELLLRFLARKHLTYDYTSIYFVFAGAAGAGKGLFVEYLLKYLAGQDRVMSDTLKGLENNFNSKLSTIDYLEIDEAGEGYTKMDNSKLVSALKRLTGNKNITIEAKGKDKIVTRQFITPVISTNLDTKLITSDQMGDRRMVFINSPKTWEGFKGMDVSDSIKLIQEELPSFAYYITTLSPISNKDYTNNKNWKSGDYLEYIERTLTGSEKLVDALRNNDLDKFIEILRNARVSENDIDNLFMPSKKEARFILYNTPTSRTLGYVSLNDLLNEVPYLSSDREITRVYVEIPGMRKSFKVLHNNLGATVTVMFFDAPYTPFNVDIEPTGSNGTEINLI